MYVEMHVYVYTYVRMLINQNTKSLWLKENKISDTLKNIFNIKKMWLEL